MNPNLTAVASLVEAQWKAKQFKLAKSTEEQSIKFSSALLPFSCTTAETLDKFITVDAELIKMKQHVMKLQSEPDSVLIVGETGTGKELIARALHGSRSGKFVAVNCTSLPDQLIESELFGHKKGSFTGAIDDRPGKFEEAWRGTLFLDEIGDMPINMQSKLLRVLQERVFTPVGDNKEIGIECRIVCATNKTIEELLNKRHFRSDLYHRLNTFILKTKPLRERICDIEHIVDSLGGEKLVEKFEEWKKRQARAIDNDITWNEWCYMTFFRLEGNVRSLQSQVRRYQVLGE